MLARFRVAMRCRRVGNSPVFQPASPQNPLFSPFDLWLADARPLDFMRVGFHRGLRDVIDDTTMNALLNQEAKLYQP